MSRPAFASRQTRQLLAELLRAPARWRHGYELSLTTGLRSGTLYPLLMRLSEHGNLESRWGDAEPGGRPPRHEYRLTPNGLKLARERAALPSARALRRVPAQARA